MGPNYFQYISKHTGLLALPWHFVTFYPLCCGAIGGPKGATSPQKLSSSYSYRGTKSPSPTPRTLTYMQHMHIKCYFVFQCNILHYFVDICEIQVHVCNVVSVVPLPCNPRKDNFLTEPLSHQISAELLCVLQKGNTTYATQFQKSQGFKFQFSC